MDDRIDWLLTSDEPWTRYRTLVDLCVLPGSSAEVEAARDEMLNHPQVKLLIEDASGWPGYALTRHNDAKHPIYKLSTLADFGLKVKDEGLREVVEAVLSHQSPEGAFESQIMIPKALVAVVKRAGLGFCVIHPPCCTACFPWDLVKRHQSKGRWTT